VSEKVLRQLGALGVSWRTRPTLNAEGRFVLEYRLRHVCGDEETGTWPLTGGTPQQIGSSITYARRYALMAVTGVFPAKEDDDGAAASGAPRHEDEWSTAKPAVPEQIRLFEEYLAKVKQADAQEIPRLGADAKEALRTGRITQVHYDRLDRAAGARLAALRQEEPA
jgi:hypothetical protein